MIKASADIDIDKAANELVRQCKIAAPPVPVERIARSLGAELRYLPYDGDLSGMIFRDGNRTVIGVNSLHHPNRQRFTIAHELGHMLLHGNSKIFIDRGSLVYRRDATSSQGTEVSEIEANRFAAELLMPRRFLERDLASAGIDLEDEETLSKLAKKYGVSVQALMWRIDYLFNSP
jgi:Zn-dependent peptidase ImmA (M78 family)